VILFEGLRDLTREIQTIDVSESNGVINIVTRKAKASPHALASAYATSPIRARSGGRRALGVAACLAKRGYRPDLRAVSVIYL
jgi:large subunit ribosomal protein L28e